MTLVLLCKNYFQQRELKKLLCDSERRKKSHVEAWQLRVYEMEFEETST